MKIIIISSERYDSYNIGLEASICNSMFACGLEIFHLRLPKADASIYEKYIKLIEPCYRERIMIHAHYELVHKYGLRGVHLRYCEVATYTKQYNEEIGVSCHSLTEIISLPSSIDYAFLSPIFDSISKQGYKSTFVDLKDVSELPCRVVALGGINPDNIHICKQLGFWGIATLGYIWEHPNNALTRYLRLSSPITMSIAGFDPSSGAGVSADIKVFEANCVYGLGVTTAITYQNEDRFVGCKWLAYEEIVKQCDILFEKYHLNYIKIGLIESLEVLDNLLTYLLTHNPNMKIIWDPILKSSSGYSFNNYDGHKLISVLKRIYLITPNTNELIHIFGKEGIDVDNLKNICSQYDVSILWKGGHNIALNSKDILITSDEETYEFELARGKYDKHGTGCILSAVICSMLTRGYVLKDACNYAQVYVSQAMDSNDTKLAYHYLMNAKRYNSNKVKLRDIRLQYITAPKDGMSIYEQVEEVCKGGVRLVQLRMKGVEYEELLAVGKLVKEICCRYGVIFIINDNVMLARQLNADGVHLGKEDMRPSEARKILGSNKIIGATCNTWNDVVTSYDNGVDYIGLGPYAFTTTKENLSPTLGLKGYIDIVQSMKENKISLPIFAIGGIEESDIKELLKIGVQGVALSGIIKNSDDICAKSLEICELIN